jgi:hypothetical protein
MSEARELCAIETRNLKNVQDDRLEFYGTLECPPDSGVISSGKPFGCRDNQLKPGGLELSGERRVFWFQRWSVCRSAGRF